MTSATTPTPPIGDRTSRSGSRETGGPQGRVFLLRHGQTALNADGRLRGRLDPPLDQQGLAEVAALAETFADRSVLRIGSSPLRRALDTADAVSSVTGAPVLAVPGLVDRDYAHWAGMLESEVIRRFGSVDAAPGVEPISGVAARVRDVLGGQLALLYDGDVVLVAHDAVNRALLGDLDAQFAGGVRQRTACWNEIRREAGRWVVVRVDQKTPSSPRPRT